MIQERVRAGLKRARAQGKVLGRPKVSMEIEKRVRAARAKVRTMIRIAREIGIGTGTVQRILAACGRRRDWTRSALARQFDLTAERAQAKPLVADWETFSSSLLLCLM